MFTKEMEKTLIAKMHEDTLTEIAGTASVLFPFFQNCLLFNNVD